MNDLGPIPILVHKDIPADRVYIFPSGVRMPGAEFKGWLFDGVGAWPRRFTLFPRWDAFWKKVGR